MSNYQAPLNVTGTNVVGVSGDGTSPTLPYDTTAKNYRQAGIARVPLAGVVATTGGAVGSWINPETTAIIVTQVVIDTTVKSTGTANLSAGSAANTTTASANLIDTLDVGTAIVTADNIADKGTNGKDRQKVAKGAAVTFTGSADTTGLVGFAYISYFRV